MYTRKTDLGREVIEVTDLPGLHALAKAVPVGTPNRSKCRTDSSWYGCKDYNTSLEQLRSGDLSGVPASDALMTDLEAQVPLSRGWQTIHDVVGGAPDVGAFLAGHPLTMRRRQRVTSIQAPLSIIASLELSSGIEIEVMRKRGAAVLALARRLCDVRPVELFVACSVGERRKAVHLAIKIDTTPLDLARAAHVLTCPSVTRGICYATCTQLAKQDGWKWDGHWAYGDHEIYRKNARAILQGITNPSAEVLYLPAAHLHDPCVKTPVKWIQDMIAQYGGMEIAA